MRVRQQLLPRACVGDLRDGNPIVGTGMVAREQDNVRVWPDGGFAAERELGDERPIRNLLLLVHVRDRVYEEIVRSNFNLRTLRPAAF